MKAVAALVLFMFSGSVGGPGPQYPPLPEGFLLTLERDGAVWKATCERGCTWLEVRYECVDGPCSALIDEHGVSGSASPGTTEAAFAFRVTPTEDGWKATRLQGSTWVSVSWGCTLQMFCKARVDEGGVGPGWY